MTCRFHSIGADYRAEDHGGARDHSRRSSGSRVRLWKLELQKLADKTGRAIAVSHFPSGTSKNKDRTPPVLISSVRTVEGSLPPVRRLIVNLIAGSIAGNHDEETGCRSSRDRRSKRPGKGFGLLDGLDPIPARGFSQRMER